MSYSLARILAWFAEREALSMGVPMAIAITDEHGGLVFLGRMDGTLPASPEIAAGKAYTAAALRLPTDEVGRLAQPGSVLYGIQNTHGGKIVLFGGGMPLCIGERVAGGIGISGGTVEEDVRVASQTLKILEKMETLGVRLSELFPKDRFPPEVMRGVVAEIRKELETQRAFHMDTERMALLLGALILEWGEGCDLETFPW